MHSESVSLTFKAVIFAASLSAGLAQAVSLPVFNTGVSTTGALLPLGDLDPNWTIVSGPGVTAPQSAVVLTSQRNPLGTYYVTTDSRWIWVDASGVAGTNSPYTFELKFDLTGFDASTFSVTGAWGVDNVGAIRLNGNAPIGTGALTIANISNFLAPNAFAITGGFVPGINTLDIQATDQGFVGGLDVTALSAAGTLLPVPEPDVWALFALGATVLISLRNRTWRKDQLAARATNVRASGH